MEKLLTVNFSKNRRKKLFLIHFTVILGLAMLGFVIRKTFFSDKINPTDQITAGILSVFIIGTLWISLNWINFYLNKKLPYKRGITKRIVVQLIIGQIFLYSVLSILTFGFAPRIFQAEMTREIIFASYFIYFLINVAANAALIGQHFFIEWKKSLLRQERLEKEKSLAHFENLKNQLNPHFLFNSLSSLNSLIYENPDLASKFLKQLSKVYRYVLENNENDPVTLDTEINFVQNYISLLQTRFGEGLEVNIDISPKDRQLRIVPVTLQILVENAIKHNSTFEDNPLIINIYTDNGYLIVKNNQQPKTRVEGSNKKGLNNLQALYQYTTGKEAHIHNSKEHFTVEVPLIDTE